MSLVLVDKHTSYETQVPFELSIFLHLQPGGIVSHRPWVGKTILSKTAVMVIRASLSGKIKILWAKGKI